MKTIVILAVCVALSGCAGGAELKPSTRAANLETLKEVNRHIELCERTYAWPFTALVTCKPAMAPAPIDPAFLRQVIREEVERALRPET
jgi:hypothetical protein